MKKLIIMRHAKSSWDNLDLSDHDRPLNDQGRAACEKIAIWLRQGGHQPDQVFCSTAQRCVETWEGVGMAAEFNAPVEYIGSMYHSSAEQLLSQIQNATEDCLMIFAHNPGIADFAHKLHAPGQKPIHQKFNGYPSGAVCILEFDVDHWSEVQLGSGRGISFVVPKEL